MIKLFAFLALCVHWFNPFVWFSFVLMSHDMEMSCDEQVIKELGTDIKKDYSTSILSLAVNRNLIFQMI
ncbi:M56 family metallopeptidase [Clostridium formicaceticum]|uniref:M56 family metallopeptidase n=1 Tax=Clostridium formicaceticum TaxID=1497 RepID=UPI001F31B763|nr:M56 family metallopeptidase [Clostridium formicaceticum]